MGSLSERKWGWLLCHPLYLCSPSPLYHQGSSTTPPCHSPWGSRVGEEKTFKSVEEGGGGGENRDVRRVPGTQKLVLTVLHAQPGPALVAEPLLMGCLIG